MDAKSQDWYEGFVAFVGNKIITDEEMIIVDDRDSYYGSGMEYEMSMHVHNGCALRMTGTSSVNESTRYEFGGTFVEEDDTYAILEVTDVSCACGTIQKRKARIKGTISEVLTSIFAPR